MRFFVRHRFQAVNWLMVALYLAAAGRGLIPGMCSTLLNTAEAGEFASEAHASCCSADLCPPADDEEGPAFRPYAEPHPPCAFCNLALARVFGAAAFVIPAPGDAPATLVAGPTASPLLPLFAGTNVGRDPPLVLA